MTVLGLLPISVLVLLWLAVPGKTQSWAERFPDALLVWGIVIVLFTEGLSLFGLLRPAWTTILWLLLASSLLIYLAWSARGMCDKMPQKLAAVIVDGKAAVVSILIIAGITLLIALIAPPNNWDSMTYHMSRVANWVQNGSVSHYPTHTDRQLYSPPFAEFAILQFQVLAGSDRFANLVQWVSMIGSLTSVFLIAQRLGANRTGQVFSVVYAATIPMGILQSTSTQTDYVVTLWLACFVYFLLIDLQTSLRWNAVKIGVALGLAILTKPTAYIYAFPFFAWYLLAKLRKKDQSRNFLSAISIIGTLVILLNVGHYYRNLTWFGSLLGPTKEVDWNVNSRFGLDVTISNMIRNATFHLATHRPDINKFIKDVVYKLHFLIGIDVNDPSTTKAPPYRINALSTHEDRAGNPVHFVLGIISVFLILLHPTIRRDPILIAYVGMIILAFVLFCFYNRWSPFRQRLHLTLFVLIAPAIGLVICEWLYDRYVRIVACGLLISAIPWLLINNLKPIIPVARFSKIPSILTTERERLYFGNRSRLRNQYLEGVAVLNQLPCRIIGFVSGADDWEYPFWVLLHATGQHFSISYPDVSLNEEESHVPDDICALVYFSYGKAKMSERRRETLIYERDDLAIVRNMP